MQLHEIILYVSDMKVQSEFYRDTLGLTVHHPSDIDDLSNEYWVVFDTGPCKLALHVGGEKQFGKDAPKIVFKVENLESKRTELISKGLKVDEIHSPAEGVFVANSSDPEGNQISFESLS